MSWAISEKSLLSFLNRMKADHELPFIKVAIFLYLSNAIDIGRGEVRTDINIKPFFVLADITNNIAIANRKRITTREANLSRLTLDTNSKAVEVEHAIEIAQRLA